MKFLTFSWVEDGAHCHGQEFRGELSSTTHLICSFIGPTSTVLERLQLCNGLEKGRAAVPGGDKYFIISACHYYASEQTCQLKALLKNFVDSKRAAKQYGLRELKLKINELYIVCLFTHLVSAWQLTACSKQLSTPPKHCPSFVPLFLLLFAQWGGGKKCLWLQASICVHTYVLFVGVACVGLGVDTNMPSSVKLYLAYCITQWSLQDFARCPVCLH